MNETNETALSALQSFNRLRDWFADSLGIRPEHKEEIYLDLARSASLRDTAYWLQLIFAAGVATLGLAQGSPAVIIGAMLISPLMGPILAAGLALAAGNLAMKWHVAGERFTIRHNADAARTAKIVLNVKGS